MRIMLAIILFCAFALPVQAELETDVSISSYNSLLNTPSGYGGFDVNISITNPYANTVIDSAIIGGELINGFTDSIVAVNPAIDRQTVIDYLYHYSNFDFSPVSDYTKSNGWDENQDATGITTITNNGIMPGVTYPEWTKDGTAILHGTFDAGWLDTDGVAGYNPATDARIKIDWDQPYVNTIVGYISGGYYNGDLPLVTAIMPVEAITVNSGDLCFADKVIAIGFTNNTSDYIKLRYSIDNGVTFADIDNSLHLAGPVYWHIPAGIDSENCIIKATTADGTAFLGESETFSIKPCSVTADLTGDCYVDLEDFAILASEWLAGEDYE